MSLEEWEVWDPQALGGFRLSLLKSVAYNISNERITSGLLKALSNMYEKPSSASKVLLIRQLANTKMKEGVQALLLLFLLPNSGFGTVTAVISSFGIAKRTFEGIRNLILGEDIRRRNAGECSDSALATEERRRRPNRGGGGDDKGISKPRRRG
ncbi:hypothetical protein L1887_40803 [Cichorium endivia]|nr:hypothetical protein L1887_40803 [Cichorium endivia]